MLSIWNNQSNIRTSEKESTISDIQELKQWKYLEIFRKGPHILKQAVADPKLSGTPYLRLSPKSFWNAMLLKAKEELQLVEAKIETVPSYFIFEE